MPQRHHLRQFPEMLRPPLRHTVRKFRPVPLAAQVNVLHLNIDIRTATGKQKIHPAAGAILHFRPNRFVLPEAADPTFRQRLANQTVRQRGIDTGQMPTLEFDQPPGIAQLPFRIVRRLQPDHITRRLQPEHCPGIGAMRRHFPPIIEHDVGEKTFIPLQQTAADQGVIEFHAASHNRAAARDKQQMTNPTAAMITIGDEILSGRTRDTNMPHLAAALTELGIDLRETRVVPDVAAEIIAAVNALRSRYDHVFTSGGIGPTHDDITADCIAAAFGVGIDVREDARAILATNYTNPEVDLNPARLRMARIPDGATLIENPISKAPGFSLGNVHVMAGVPSVFVAMLASVLPTLTGGRPLLSATVRFLVREGDIAGPLATVAAAHPDVSIGSYPFSRDGVHGSNVVLRSQDAEKLKQATRDVEALLATITPA